MQPTKSEKTADSASLTVWVFNVGKGDNILIRLPDGRFVVIDFYFSGQTDEVPALTYLKYGYAKPFQVSLINITHLDKDHYWGGRDFLGWCAGRAYLQDCVIVYSSAYEFAHTIRHLTNVKPVSEHSERDSLILLINEFKSTRQVQGIEPLPELETEPNLRAYVLTPLPEDASKFKADSELGQADPNPISTAIQLKYLDYALLFGADLPATHWHKLFTYCETSDPPIAFPADFVKASHHGATNASSVAIWQTLGKSDTSTHIVFTANEKYPTVQTLNDLETVNNMNLLKYITCLSPGSQRSTPKKIPWKKKGSKKNSLIQNKESVTARALVAQHYQSTEQEHPKPTANSVDNFIGFEFTFTATGVEVRELYPE